MHQHGYHWVYVRVTPYACASPPQCLITPSLGLPLLTNGGGSQEILQIELRTFCVLGICCGPEHRYRSSQKKWLNCAWYTLQSQAQFHFCLSSFAVRINLQQGELWGGQREEGCAMKYFCLLCEARAMVLFPHRALVFNLFF